MCQRSRNRQCMDHRSGPIRTFLQRSTHIPIPPLSGIINNEIVLREEHCSNGKRSGKGSGGSEGAELSYRARSGCCRQVACSRDESRFREEPNEQGSSTRYLPTATEGCGPSGCLLGALLRGKPTTLAVSRLCSLADTCVVMQKRPCATELRQTSAWQNTSALAAGQG